MTNAMSKMKCFDDPSLLTYKEYYEKQISLKKYKVPQLKLIAKKNHLLISGNKTVLIERIQERFMKMVNATKIQTIYRGYLIRHSFRLRGEAFKNRSICVNDTDFVTLEPLVEIPFHLFFSYKDDKNFIYGFNIDSLIQILKTKGKLDNPYNRELMNINVIEKVVSLNNINQIAFNNVESDSKPVRIIIDKNSQIINRNIMQETGFNNILSNYYFEPRITTPLNTPIMRTNRAKILEMRIKPVETRIQQLFMEIDQLGNYTQSSWFSNLDRVSYLRLYRSLFDIWSYRGQLSIEVRHNICPLFDPFASIFITPMQEYDITQNQIKFLCLTIMENIIYCGVDLDYKKLGTLHVLSALTLVSIPARNAMPWLYESLV